MAALTGDKNTVRFGRMLGDAPSQMGVKAATRLYAGALVVNDAGVAAPGRTATGLNVIGVARKNYDNTTGIANAMTGEYDMGDYLFVNSTAGDLIAAVDVGNDCFIVDDQTVAKTSATSTRSRAGKVIAVDPPGYTGVVVRVGVGF